MYAALWRLLPGPVWVRALLMLALAAAVFLLLMQVVFPWLADVLPLNDQTIETMGRPLPLTRS